jgi:hypothetical protein
MQYTFYHVFYIRFVSTKTLYLLVMLITPVMDVIAFVGTHYNTSCTYAGHLPHCRTVLSHWSWFNGHCLGGYGVYVRIICIVGIVVYGEADDDSHSFLG